MSRRDRSKGRGMKTKPPGVEYEPFLCPICLYEGIVRRTWVDHETLLLVCAAHGDILAVQVIQ